jgi:hypothetical protein
MSCAVASRRSGPIAGLLAVLVLSACAAGVSTTPPATESANAPTGQPTPSASASRRPFCPNGYGGSCLGPLAAGTYSTRSFQPRLTYSVPAGWDNEEDLAGNFLLLPPGAKLDGVDAGTSDYVGVYTQITPDPACPTPSQLATDIPQEMAECIASRSDLVTTAPQPVQLGGLSGFALDVTSAPGIDGTSLMVGQPPSEFEHGLGPGLTIRLYLLGFRSGTLAVEIDDVGSPDLTTSDRMVQSFQFES